MSQLAVKVTRTCIEAQDIASFELASADGSMLPPFDAGAHIDVHIRDGLIRQYSLCNDPSERHRYVIGVLRDPNSRGGSIAMHEEMAEGRVVQISVPRNHFPLVHAKRSLLFAGGIGVTPILSMAEFLAKSGADFEMHYCSRSPERTAFHERIARSPFADKVHFHFDTGAAEQKLEIENLMAHASPETHLYVCGPGGFIDFVVRAAKRHGWPSERIHFEYFSAAPQDTSSDRAFEVKLASSGETYAIPANKTVISVLAEHGIDLPVSCEQGVCGTCLTRVLDGTPDHRDVYLTDEEKAANDCFTPCCSRSRSGRLVLDL